jgi:hypothetical protein
MPIPALNGDGLLPAGVHDCTLEDIRERFGSFQGNDCRPKLFVRLGDLIASIRRSGLFEAVLVDGSFVTEKVSPNDIDLVAVLRPGHDFERELSVSEYALVSRALLRRRYRFDIVVAERESVLYSTYVDFFGQVRDAPELRKGLLRVSL